MKRIEMQVIPHSEQRYDTLGDYWIDEAGVWQFRVSDLGDWRYNYSVLLHEFVEFALLQYRGVPEATVLAFDLAVPEGGEFADDPGCDPAAPYHAEHMMAERIERLLAPQLGVAFEDTFKAAIALPQWQTSPQT